MTMQPDYPVQFAQRIRGSGDRRYCSRCGSVIGNDDPTCLHCHARFDAPPPLTDDDQARPTPRRRSVRLDIFAVFLWAVIIALLYVCWHVGTTLGGVAGSGAGPFLFVTLATPIYAMWVYGAYRLPAPRLAAFVIDLFGIWAYAYFVLALPVRVYLALLSFDDGWLAQIAAYITTFFIIAMIFPLGTRLFSGFIGPLSTQMRSNLTPQGSREELIKGMIENLLIFVIPLFAFRSLVTQLPDPWGLFVGFAQLAWFFMLFDNKMRERVRRPVVRWIERLYPTRSKLPPLGSSHD